MTHLNKYQKNIDELINRTKSTTSIEHLKGITKGKTCVAATWDDKLWRYIDSYGRESNVYFTRAADVRLTANRLNLVERLPYPAAEVLMCYALNTFSRSLSLKAVCENIRIARIIAQDHEDIFSISTESIRHFKDMEPSTVRRVSFFIDWLKAEKLIPQSVKTPDRKTTKTRIGDEVTAHRSSKLPEEKILLALGSILHDTIPPEDSVWRTGPLDNIREAFVLTNVALAMSSPNRVYAEHLILENQLVSLHDEMIEGDNRTVHYLNWKGSKGFKGNQNHILSSMAPTVDRCLRFIQKASKHNRALARFYKNPGSTLKTILGDFSPDPARLRVAGDVHKLTNLFVLGFILGLYGDDDPLIQVRKSGSKPATQQKPISKLAASDEIVGSKANIKKLFVSSTQHRLAAKLIKSSNTVHEIQTRWIEHIKESFPIFPKLACHAKYGESDIEARLFSLSGMQMGSITAGVGCNSPYFLSTATTQQACIKRELGGEIFKRHGFSRDFRVTPHQFRHFLNDAADKNGLPRMLINMWSGRKDPSQIVHYVHSTDDERSMQVSDILFNEEYETIESAKRNIKVWSKHKWDDLTGEIATVTSSGICTQPLHVNPCSYLNDFNTQCTLCSKSCHIAHDTDSIDILKKDLAAQEIRLDACARNPRLKISDAMRSWYKAHAHNVDLLRQLINLMTDESIEEGSLIRVLMDRCQFKISNLNTKLITTSKISLPNASDQFEEVLAKHTSKVEDAIINDLLELL